MYAVIGFTRVCWEILTKLDEIESEAWKYRADHAKTKLLEEQKKDIINNNTYEYYCGIKQRGLESSKVKVHLFIKERAGEIYESGQFPFICIEKHRFGDVESVDFSPAVWLEWVDGIGYLETKVPNFAKKTIGWL